jgi:hypothetical protein
MFYLEDKMEAVSAPSRTQIFENPSMQFSKIIKKFNSVLPILIGAIVLFEIFNYSTTEHALSDTMGGLGFLGIRLATILALAFCGIDFAGVARLFSREERAGQEREEEWYLLSAWLMAGLLNAIMTWWSVTETLLAQPDLGNELFSRQAMVTYVPIFVAGAVWMIRILLIGSLTLHVKRVSNGDRRSAAREGTHQRSVRQAQPAWRVSQPTP